MRGEPPIRFPWRRSLRTRLTLLFAALGLIPAVIVGYAVLRNLTQGIDVWENPGVTATMESVRQVARTSVDKLVSNLTIHAQHAIEATNLRNEVRDASLPTLTTLKTQSELDLVALYVRDDRAWRPRLVLCDDPLTLASEEVELALQLTSLQTGEQGYLMSAFPFEEEGAEYALLLGYRLGPEYLPQLETIAAGLTYYNQLRLVKQVTRQSALLTAGMVTLVALGVALVLGRWVARDVSKPVEDLVAGMQAVGRGQPARVQPRGTDELRFLSKSFNRMTRELDETRRELAKAERLAAWQEMARRIAHEIRNPLTPIQFALHRLQRRTQRGETPAPADIQESVDAILEELEGLRALAGTFSEFARLPDPEPVSLDLNDLVRSVAGLLDGQAASVELDLDDTLPPLTGDRKGLRRVLTNLTKNASETGTPRIRVATRRVRGGETPMTEDMQLGPGSRRSLLAEPHVVVTVEDWGPGLPAESLDAIFMPNYTTKASGTGLGLAIVCRIIAQHNGAIVVERGEPTGTRLHVHLPILEREAT